MFLYKNLLFFNIFFSVNPNHAYWNQRQLFSGNLPDMFLIAAVSLSTAIIYVLSFFKNWLYLLITFFVLHKSQFSRSSSDLLHSLFQINVF